jgi:hypothetical protein
MERKRYGKEIWEEEKWKRRSGRALLDGVLWEIDSGHGRAIRQEFD